MATPSFDSVRERMFRRVGAESLACHLEDAYDIEVSKAVELDVGVFRCDLAAGGAVVARLFPATRGHSDAEADLAVLRHLEAVDFPAERPFRQALSRHEGQSVLVTGFVASVPKAKQPPHPIFRLGARVAVLNRLDVPAAAERPAGALHHYADGTLGDELRAMTGWLDSIADQASYVESLAALRAAVTGADGGDGLPDALVHPDPVPRNAIMTENGPVLIDWTAAGRGPRLAAMTRPLRSSWAGVPFLRGWTRRASLTSEECERLPGLLFSRGLTDLVFRVCAKPSTAATAGRKVAALHRDSARQAEMLLDAL